MRFPRDSPSTNWARNIAMNTKDTVIPTLLADELLFDRKIRPLLCIIMEEINTLSMYSKMPCPGAMPIPRKMVQ